MKKIIDSSKFNFWIENLKRNGFTINGIEEKFTRYFNGEPILSTVLLDAITPEGDKIPPTCFLKGHVVSVMIIFFDAKTMEKYVLLVRQRRIGDGSLTYEHPAGMVKDNEEPIEVAIREVKEETGLKLHKKQLTKLNNKLLFANPGTSDEAFHFYFCEIPLGDRRPYTEKDIESNEDFEKISTIILPLEEAHKHITNTNLLLQNYLYLSYKKEFGTITKLLLH